MYEQYKGSMNNESLDEFRNAIVVEPIIPASTQTLIDNALKRGENLSFTASNYEITLKEKNKDILAKLVNDSIARYINRYKPTYTIQEIGNDIYNYDYSDSYVLLNERVKMMEMAIFSYENKK